MILDDGAVRALTQHKSLFPSGVKSVAEGNFLAQDAVHLVAEDGTVIASGLSNYSSQDVEKLLGQQSDKIEVPLTHKISRIPCHFAQPFWAYELPHRREQVPGAVF